MMSSYTARTSGDASEYSTSPRVAISDHSPLGLLIQIQQVTVLSHIHGRCFSQLVLRAGGLMNMPAEKIARLLTAHKFTHGPAAGVLQIRDAIERSAERRRMADRDHRFYSVESVQ